MSSAQVGAVLRQIRQLAAARHDPERPDHQLLERFAAHRDGDAFAALLRRHGPMVLGVCHSVLRDTHEAEDAFQAAFLLLARKAGSIRRREAVSGWLYRVAYRLAVRARATAARRRVQESRPAAMPPADPVLDLSLREVRAVLLEELDGLPEQYRAPLVLCGLEEKPLEEAARLLGWVKGAVKWRLQRGRELLRRRLRRRGLELPAALAAAALALNAASGPVSAALASSTLRAAVKAAAGGGMVGGGVTAEVADLVQGASRIMGYSKITIAAALLTAALGAAGLGTVTLRALAAGPADPERKEAAAAPPPGGQEAAEEGAKDVLTVRGRVLDPDGKPVAGAKLYVHDPHLGDKDDAARATSGGDGSFRFTVAKSEMTQRGYPLQALAADVMAVAKGYGCAWAAVGEADARREVTLRLVKDVPISGRVLDSDGQPVAGAKVRLTSLRAFPGEDLTKMLKAAALADWSAPLLPAKYWGGPLPGQARAVITGADGRFRLAGLGRERTVGLRVEGPAIQSALITVMTRPGKGVMAPQAVSKVYGAAFDYLAAPSRPIRGVVRDKATGKPVAGATVYYYHLPLYGTTVTVQTDKEGRYELLGCPKAPTYKLFVVPPDGLHFGRQAQVADPPGFAPVTVDFELPAGITARGRVLDKATGKPVSGVRVSYYILFPNPKAGPVADYLPFWGAPPSAARTGPDGSFAVTVLPGPGVLAAAAEPPSAYRSALVTPKELEEFFKERPDPMNTPDALAATPSGIPSARPVLLGQSQYHALALLNPQEKDRALDRDLVLLPPLTRQVTVVGPDGKPLPGVTAYGQEEDLGGPVLLKSATFTVRRLHPTRTRHLFLYHAEKRLGRTVDLRGADADPLQVELRPCGSATGRLVDQGGKPLGGTTVQLWFQGPGQPRYFVPLPGIAFEVQTDPDGRFRAEGLVPGRKYYVLRPDTNFKEVTVESGKTKDLGDVAVAVDRR
jgi:RNA polymerase sigma factor (sigma-70 family)